MKAFSFFLKCFDLKCTPEKVTTIFIACYHLYSQLYGLHHHSIEFYFHRSLTSDLSTNKRTLLKDGDMCCTNPSLSNAWFWQYIKGLKIKIRTAVRRNLEEILDVKTFLTMSIGFKCRGSKFTILLFFRMRSF